MDKITVIMPSLNVGGFIRECLQSVVVQTFSNLEILCIDAGSTDGTLEIIKEFQERDERIQIVCSDRKSYGYQVNMGIAMASGDYVGIVETDDIIEPDMFEALYIVAKREDADYVKGEYQKFCQIDGKWFLQPHFTWKWENGEEYRVFCPRKTPKLIYNDHYLWNGLYRADFIRNIVLNESPGAAYQDWGFDYQVYRKAEKAAYINHMVYNYRQDNPSNSCASPKAFQYILQELQYVEGLGMELSHEVMPYYYMKVFSMICTYVKRMAMTYYWKEAENDLYKLHAVMKKVCEDENIFKMCREIYGKLLTLFLDSPQLLYEFFNESFLEKKLMFCQVLERLQCDKEEEADRKCVVFGAGRLGRFVYLTLLGRGYSPIAVCDNTVRADAYFHDTPIVSVEEAVMRYGDAVYIVANKYNAAEMKQQLMSSGISERKIVEYSAQSDDLMFYRYI